MHPFQLKTERPTLKAAHAFFKEGLSSANYVSREGREAEIKNALQEIFSIVTRQFPRTQNLEYAILKSHLIVEHALVQYIRCFSAVWV